MKKALIVFGILVVLAVAYYGLSPLFIHTQLNEQAPINTTGSVAREVVGTVGHPASGRAGIVQAGVVPGEEDAHYLRYENLKTINGPDLYVYLAKDLDAKEFVNLGRLRATEGNVNYEIPEGVDVSEYRYALTWCKQFSVLFNYADLK